MANRAFIGVVFAALALIPACSTLGDYPAEWHGARNSIRVYVAGPEHMVEIPFSGPDMTLMDAVFASKLEGDLTRVVVFRRTGTGTTRLEVDVRLMLTTGKAEQNIQLQPGDVVGIAG